MRYAVEVQAPGSHCGVHVTARVRDARMVHDVPTAKVPLQQRGAAGSQPAVPLLDVGGRRKQGTETTVSAEKTIASAAAATGQGVSQARGGAMSGAQQADAQHAGPCGGDAPAMYVIRQVVARHAQTP